MQLKNAVKNSVFGILGQVLIIFVGFFSQRTMNLRLGAELVGMNGVIANIIAILSVSELGVATAVVYNLYSAIARRDEREIAALMNLYRKAYYAFALVILCLGLAIMPFIHLFLKNVSFSLGYIRLIFSLWLARTALSYLLSYKRSVLIADQKEYIVSIVLLIVNFLNYSAIILILEVTGNYVLALSTNIVLELAGNLWLAVYVNRKYPFLVRMKNQPVQRSVLQKVADNVKNIFIQKIFTKLLLSTDNLILSGFIGAGIVGLYANYSLVTQSVINIILALSQAIRPSLGHLFLREDREKDYQILRQITFVFYMAVSVAAVCIFTLITPFVTDYWLNEDYGLGRMFVCAAVAKFFLMALGLSVEAVISVTGMFDKEKDISILAAVVNLGCSLLLVRRLGIVGVVIGSAVAYAVQILCRVRALFQKFLMRSSKVYLMDLAQYAALVVLETGVTAFLTDRIYRPGNIPDFLIIGLISALLPLGVNVLLFARSWRMESVFRVAVNILRNRRKD